MSRIVVDAWAWIDYLDGSTKGEVTRGYIEGGGNELFSPAITVGEVVSKFIRRGKDPSIAFKAMARFSKIVEIDGGIASEAGEVHADRRRKMPDFSLPDAFVIVVAQKLGAKILTADSHFKNEKNAILL